MSDKDKPLSSIEKITAGLTSHESVLKQAELASKVTTGIPKSVFDTASILPKSTLEAATTIPKSIEASIKPRSLRIPRALKDLNRSFEDFDVDGLIELKKKVRELEVYQEDGYDVLNKVEDALQGYIDKYQEFEKLNSEQFRQITMKKAELELEHENHVLKLITQDAEAKLSSKYDWKAKWRHLFIKSLGTALFIALLLFVGWLVKNYEWAELPYSSLVKSVIPLPKV